MDRHVTLKSTPLTSSDFVDDLARFARDGDLVADERHLAHVDANQTGRVVLDLHRDDPAQRLDLELLRLNVLLLEEVLGEDAQAVATLLGLAAVRVENPQGRDVTIQNRPVENPSEPTTEIAIADQPDIRLRHRHVPHVRIDHQIVIAQPMILLEMHVHQNSNSTESYRA